MLFHANEAINLVNPIPSRNTIMNNPCNIAFYAHLLFLLSTNNQCSKASNLIIAYIHFN